MLNIKKIFAALRILYDNFVSLSLIIMFFWLGNLYAQMPCDFPEGREFDSGHPLDLIESGVSPSVISKNVEFVGATGGYASDVFVQGNYAYLCAWGVLVILDISEPVHPKKVGYIALPDAAYDVYIKGSYAYVADYYYGLRVIDVSTPENPVLVGFYDTPGSAYGVYVEGSYAYVADGYGGLVIIDISRPSRPIPAGFWETRSYTYGVYVSGSYAYLADKTDGLRVIDVSTPGNPVLVGFYDTPDDAESVYVSGSYVYLADGADGLLIIDVSTPENPVLVGFYDTPGSAESVYVEGSYAYVANNLTGRLHIIDVNTPENPVEVGFYDTPGQAYDVYVKESYAYVADWNTGLRIIDISAPENPVEVGFYDTPGYADDVYVSGSYAYVADWSRGLRVIDISSPENPVEVGFYDTPDYAHGVYVEGSYAYVADEDSGLLIIDVSTPSNPVLVGFYNTPGNAYGVYVEGSYAYVADYHHGLRVIDISIPENPVEVGFYDTPDWAFDVYVEGSYAYVADYLSGLRIIDVSAPENPVEVAFYDTPGWAYSVQISGELIYVADGYGGLYILKYTSEDLDTDGDGLPDKWEVEGYNGVDLPGMGADPLHKDIFVEVDWMVAQSHDHKPNSEAIEKVVAAFLYAPVSNPDRTTGITLHVDTGELGGGNPLTHDDDLNPVWDEFDAIKRDNFAEEREPIFHYCVFAHNYNGGTSSGLSRGIPASDFIVSLGSFPGQVGTVMQQAGTFMHQLGHNLGLRHGGVDDVNYKPNYLSVMSHFFQMSGLIWNSRFGHLDYSKFLMEDLDENHLTESKGLDGVGGDDPIKSYGTKYYCSGGEVETVKSAYRFVDWNCNGERINRNVAVDLNNDSELNILTGRYNDWDNLIFDGGSIGPAFRISEAPEVFDELTLEEYLRMNPVPLEEED